MQVLTALLLAPVHHRALLDIVHTWPPHLYNLTAFTEATLKRCHLLGAFDPCSRVTVCTMASLRYTLASTAGDCIGAAYTCL